MSLERFDGGRVGRALFLYAGPADVMRGGEPVYGGAICAVCRCGRCSMFRHTTGRYVRAANGGINERRR
nr:MAG TPA: hypothetical protein [Caudoviricetes sp.]